MPRRNNAAPLTAQCHPDRRHIARGLCKQCYDKEYGQQNRQRLNERARNWQRDNPEKRRAIKVKSTYGVEYSHVQEMLREQHGLCAICKEKPATDVDHDHTSGRVRGMLCGDCNRALGLLRDNAAILHSAIQYLDRAVQVEKNTGIAFVHPHEQLSTP